MTPKDLFLELAILVSKIISIHYSVSVFPKLDNNASLWPLERIGEGGGCERKMIRKGAAEENGTGRGC